MKVGTYAVVSGKHSALGVARAQRRSPSFFPDRAFVVRSGEQSGGRLRADGPRHVLHAAPPPSGPVRRPRLLPNSDSIPGRSHTRAADFSKVIAQGRQLFLKETFDGNGRTCGTCHVETNNFTVDPALIATLPSERSALRRRDQSRAGDAGEVRPAAALRVDPGQRRRIRPVESGLCFAARRTCRRSPTR